MKSVLSLCFVLLNFCVFSQMSGELAASGRKLLSAYNFQASGSTSGIVTLDVVVNIDGNVTSTKVIKEKTTIVSTPTMMKIENKVRTLKFEKGYKYPKFHHAIFTIKVN